MTFWIALQVFIVIVETYIRWSVTSLTPSQRRKGYFCGVCAQFLWLIIFIHTGMWYLMPLLVIDGSIWLRGFIRHTKKEKDEEDTD